MESGSSTNNPSANQAGNPARNYLQSKSDTRDDNQTLTVVKREGLLVPFRRDRVLNAIEAAMRATHAVSASSPLPQDLYAELLQITEMVQTAAAEQFQKTGSLTVEQVQDLVEVKMMEAGHHDIARNFIVYREDHKQLREDSPRNIKVLRRDGKQVRFNPMKIASAIENCFRSSRNITENTPSETIQAVNHLTNRVVAQIVAYNSEGTSIQIELIQDEVEKQLMAEGYYAEAKDYILYRAQRSRERTGQMTNEASAAQIQKPAKAKKDPVVAPEIAKELDKYQAENYAEGQVYDVKGTNGAEDYQISEGQLRARVAYAARDLDVSAEEVFSDAINNFYQGIRSHEVDEAMIMSARAKVEKEPAYSHLTARVLLDKIYRETFNVSANDPQVVQKHAQYFIDYIDLGIGLDRLSPLLAERFDLKRLSQAIKMERDLGFTYLGIQTIYDRYLIHEQERRIETPQIFWMRVAMGLALEEKDCNEKAIEFYNLLSQFLFVSSTPTLFNSGTCHSQMSSCYLSTVQDDLSSIFKLVSDDAQLSKWAGGLGNDWTNVRATGSRIKGTNGKSQGVVPFLKVANDTAVAVNQGGKRKGAMCAYLETWHLDLEDFLELRKNTGDERRRTHDMNTANWIPDLFMKRVAENGSWTMFSPSDVPDLHDLYGQAFEERYCEYEAMAERGELKLHKQTEALTLWRKMLSMVFETGHPWITFKDPSNLRSPQDHAGVVHSSNLCTEILLNTSKDETAVCNLGSINLPKHLNVDGSLNAELIAQTTKTAIRMLDNVIDINFYPIAEAQNSNHKHRPVGLGIMGFQDCLYVRSESYASNEAVAFADQSMEMISYHAIMASSELAKERGTYRSYKGSKWDRGLLPIDTLDILENERGGGYCDFDTSSKLDWDKVRQSIKAHGMRNSNTMAIAPTATISNISGVTQSIEPAYKHLFAKSNLSGEFIVINTYLVDKLKELNLWDSEMVDDLKYFDGSILEIERIPEDVKQVFLTAFEIDPDWIIECAARRQKWIDMGQSLNLYIAQPSGKKLNDMYFQAWKKGLKTTYYLRSLGATQIEKSTMDVNKRGMQPRWMKNKSASSEVTVDRTTEGAAMPKAEVNVDGDCESCQ